MKSGWICERCGEDTKGFSCFDAISNHRCKSVKREDEMTLQEMRLIKTGNRLLKMMEMQEQRESEELHIPATTFKLMWDEAKEAWRKEVL